MVVQVSMVVLLTVDMPSSKRWWWWWWSEGFAPPPSPPALSVCFVEVSEVELVFVVVVAAVEDDDFFFFFFLRRFRLFRTEVPLDCCWSIRLPLASSIGGLGRMLVLAF